MNEYFNDMDLVPGLQAFMESDEATTSDDKEAEIEAAKADAEDARQSKEMAEDEAEEERSDTQAEMILRSFEECDRMYAHIRTYGVDRSFLSLCNYNNRLANSFGITLPSCESFSATGDPNSAESIACLEGLGQTLKGFWNFVWGWLKKAWEYLINLPKKIREWWQARKKKHSFVNPDRSARTDTTFGTGAPSGDGSTTTNRSQDKTDRSVLSTNTQTVRNDAGAASSKTSLKDPKNYGDEKIAQATDLTKFVDTIWRTITKHSRDMSAILTRLASNMKANAGNHAGTVNTGVVGIDRRTATVKSDLAAIKKQESAIEARYVPVKSITNPDVMKQYDALMTKVDIQIGDFFFKDGDQMSQVKDAVSDIKQMMRDYMDTQIDVALNPIRTAFTDFVRAFASWRSLITDFRRCASYASNMAYRAFTLLSKYHDKPLFAN